ncbi:hypothetical protein ACFL2K_01855 [Candidatus Margulisiibacteriota bacterium]
MSFQKISGNLGKIPKNNKKPKKTKKQKKISVFTKLPADCIQEIISFVPFGRILKYRFINKELNTLITEGAAVQKYLLNRINKIEASIGFKYDKNKLLKQLSTRKYYNPERHKEWIKLNHKLIKYLVTIAKIKIGKLTKSIIDKFKIINDKPMFFINNKDLLADVLQKMLLDFSLISISAKVTKLEELSKNKVGLIEDIDEENLEEYLYGNDRIYLKDNKSKFSIEIDNSNGKYSIYVGEIDEDGDKRGKGMLFQVNKNILKKGYFENNEFIGGKTIIEYKKKIEKPSDFLKLFS